MEVTETTADGLKRELKVVINAKDLDQRLSDRLKELKDQVRIKGFRPGKVPVTHLRKVYGRSVMAEVMQQAVSETSQQALEARAERPAFQPDIELPDDGAEIEKVIAGDADLAYTMSFEVLPEIELEDFSKIKLEKQYCDVDEKDIDKGVENLIENAITFEPKKGVAKDGDQLTLDFKGEIDGEPFEGGEAEDAPVVLGQGSFIPGFEEALTGAKAGQSLKVETKFPDDYPAEHLAGKDVVFAVDVKQVAKPVRPEADDALAKTMGFEKLDELREAVKGRLADELEAASRTKLKRALLDVLDETYGFDLPQKLVDNEFETIWRQVTSDLERTGTTFEDEDTTEEEARKHYQNIASRRVRLGLMLSEVGEKNEITVADEEVNRALMDRIRQFPGQERDVYEFYQQNPQALAELRAPIFEDKVVDFILELVKLTEKKVSRDELFKMPDDPDEEPDSPKEK